MDFGSFFRYSNKSLRFSRHFIYETIEEKYI